MTAAEHDEMARQILALQTRADANAWTFAELQTEFDRLTIDPAEQRMMRAYLGDEGAYNARRFTCKAISARWPDGWREAGRVVPDNVVNLP